MDNDVYDMMIKMFMIMITTKTKQQQNIHIYKWQWRSCLHVNSTHHKHNESMKAICHKIFPFVPIHHRHYID